MDILYIVMPAYNEEENIQKVIEQWYPILEGKAPESRLVVADSGSKDRTHEILMELKASKYPQLEILPDTDQYHGPKVIALYDYAIKNNADFIFQTDSDGQTNPDEFRHFGMNEIYIMEYSATGLSEETDRTEHLSNIPYAGF